MNPASEPIYDVGIHDVSKSTAEHWFTEAHSIVLTPVKALTKENGHTKKKAKGKKETENKEDIDASTEQKPANGTTISQ
ncbi:hypothetical protein [Arsenophonus endosymbiont of Crataerina pallida]|uniref:hypothetical protein n=1 Tax=Arsenophonus endosymbiont of Crataerina pallida TaxID=3066235 RepID=UPI0030CBF054